tara:strand:- start:1982 stop:2353 length:372 start_codon:yes stop_codon:yes gene_type:complete
MAHLSIRMTAQVRKPLAEFADQLKRKAPIPPKASHLMIWTQVKALSLKTTKKLSQKQPNNATTMMRVLVNPATAAAAAGDGTAIVTTTGRENLSHAKEFWTFVMRDTDFFAQQAHCPPTTTYT